MRVIVNATSLRPGGAGTSTYARELLRSMARRHPARELVVVVQRDARSEIPETVDARLIPTVSGVSRSLVNKLLPLRGDLLHGLDVDVPFRLVTPRIPRVATIHDLAVFDVPWAFSHFRVRGERASLRQTARTADALIAVSPFTAERVRHWLKRDAVVIPLAPAPDLGPPSVAEVDRVRARYTLPREFVLHVGTIEPRKDVWRLADACRCLGVPLCVAGADWGRAIPLPPWVQRLGFVDSDDLSPLYSAASAVAYPSLYEGFGLPPVEAMACGAAVVCSDVASLRQLLGEEAACWFPPGDIAALTEALRVVLVDRDRNEGLRRGGRLAADGLSFDDVADRTVSVWAATV
jgi:glycosyltransferase involved in cell wall biosynthesis